MIYLIWGLLDQRYFQSLGFRELYYLYIFRGVSSCLLLAGWAGWFVLRERRRWEGEVHRSWRRYQAILLHAPDAVILFDRDLTVLEWNPQAESLYGYSREEAFGAVLPILDSEELKEMRSAMERLQSEMTVELETKRRNSSGNWVNVGIRLSCFSDVDSGQTVFVEIGHDLRGQMRLRQKALEMERLTSMGRLSAGTAHALNTPLAAMLLWIEILKKHIREHPRLQELNRLESSTRFCQDFVQKLLQYSRPKESSMTCVDVMELVNSICTFFQPTFQVRGHTVWWSGENLAGSHILADRYQMEALFSALLMNSLDALSEKGTVCIDGFAEGGNLNLFVRDNGCGVPQDTLEYIFEPFFTTKAPEHGTGLGLSIARHIVQEHGGTITLSNNFERGATVCVCLPLCKGKEQTNCGATKLCPASGSQRSIDEL
jgi:PAS domain S-box-containing protein